MTEEQQKNLNFYSKYTRSKDKHSINSLYNLIDGAKSASNLEIKITTSRVREKPQPEPKRKASASPIKKLKTPASAKHEAKVASEADSEQEEHISQLSNKILQLKKMEDQFHEELDRRQKEIRKRRQTQVKMKESKKKQPQPQPQQNLINVVEMKQTSPVKNKSSEHREVVLKRTSSMREPEPQTLDFNEYYREEPEVPISTAYDHSPDNRKELRNTLEMQKLRQKQVQSVDQQGQKSNSIVIERLDITARLQNQDSLNNKNLYDLQMSHSKSQNILDQFRSSQEFQKDDKEQSPHIEIQPPKEEDRWHLNINTAPKQVESMDYINHDDIPTSPLPEGISAQNVEMERSECQKIDLVDQNLDILPRERASSGRQAPPVPVTNRTGTDQGSELKQQIADQVEPMANKSQCIPKSIEIQTPIFHSQAAPTSKLHLSREVLSIATDSHDITAIDSPSSAKNQRIQHKKSSFKKLMAENRANLVPRMAISTILNQHINQALGQNRQAQVHPPATPDLKESVFEPVKQSPPSAKKKVNFKQRLAQQKREKTYSRDGKPNFERDKAKTEKNRGLLVGFFQDN